MIQEQVKSKTILSAGDIVQVDVQGFSVLMIELTGTIVATTIFEYTINGADWYTLTAYIVGSSTSATGATAAGKWVANVAGFLAVRVRCSAFTSGEPKVYLRAVAFGNVNTPSGDEVLTTESKGTPTPGKITATGSQTIFALNTSMKTRFVYNAGTTPYWLSFTSPATSSNAFFKLEPQMGIDLNDLNVAIYGIQDSGTPDIRTVETV